MIHDQDVDTESTATANRLMLAYNAKHPGHNGRIVTTDSKHFPIRIVWDGGDVADIFHSMRGVAMYLDQLVDSTQGGAK